MRYAAVAMLAIIATLSAVFWLVILHRPHRAPPPPAPPSVRTTTAARILRVIPRARLVSAVVVQSIEVTKKHESWRGDVQASVIQPVRVSFAVDLTKVTSVRWHPARKLLAVQLPALEVSSIDHDPKLARTFLTVGWARTNGRAGQFWLSRASRDVHSVATELAKDPKILTRARQLSLPAIRSALERLIRPIEPDAVVRVAFDDKTARAPRAK